MRPVAFIASFANCMESHGHGNRKALDLKGFTSIQTYQVGLLCRGCENQFFRNGHILGCSDETGVQQMMPKPSEQTSRSPVSSPCHSISRKKRKDLMQLSAFCFRFVFSIYTCFVNLILSILVWDTLCACCSLCENPANSPRRMCRAA